MADLESVCDAVVEKMFAPAGDLFAGNEKTVVPRSAAAAPVEESQVAAEDTDTAAPFVLKPPSERVKNVAVVETEIDAQSGASSELTSADARLVTAELRREAVKNLPRGRYNVMTSETVYAQGSAVLEKCADENCVIVLGSAIGADFIVRGSISKVQTKLTLSVEIYETEDGNLVASSDPIRSESLEDLLEQAASVCAEMYRTFVSAQTPAPAAPAAPRKPRKGRSVGVGAQYAGGFGGGVAWSDGSVSIPYTGGGVYLFFSHTYAAAHIAYLSGGGRWESDNRYDDIYDLPDMRRVDLNAGIYAKYPVNVSENITVFPLAGLDYSVCASAKLVRADGSGYAFDGANGRRHVPGDLNELWLRAGAGIDIDMGSPSAYIRGELQYGGRLANAFEQSYLYENGYTRLAHGLVLKVGAGIRL
jgi:TolB-like protein